MKFNRKKSMRVLACAVAAIATSVVAMNLLTDSPGIRSASASTSVATIEPSTVGNTLNRAPSFTSAVVAGLNDMEASRNFRDIRLAVLDNGHNIPADQRDAVIAWLELRATHAEFPAGYGLARQYSLAGDTRSAATWYVTAGLMARVDASRFETPTINVAGAVRPFFADIIAMLDEPSLRTAAVEQALKIEHQLCKRDPAHWLAPGQSRLVDDPIWQARRTELREQASASVK